ncbi:Mu transposase domain-containing protein, partial [Corynebacterium striatum]
MVFVEGHSITFELFGVPRHGGRLPFFPTQPGWISGVYQTGVTSQYYSVPFQLVGESVTVRLTPQLVSIFNGEQLVAEHTRLHGFK